MRKLCGYLLMLALSVSACAAENTDGKSTTITQSPGIACKERSDMCTMEFLPVCGIRSNSSVETFSNACTACSDESIIWYNKGECAAPKIK